MHLSVFPVFAKRLPKNSALSLSLCSFDFRNKNLRQVLVGESFHLIFFSVRCLCLSLYVSLSLINRKFSYYRIPLSPSFSYKLVKLFRKQKSAGKRKEFRQKAEKHSFDFAPPVQKQRFRRNTHSLLCVCVCAVVVCCSCYC